METTSTATPPTDIFESLTPAQLAAVTHVDGPLLILAGPGSGKTRVVTHRIAHLLQQGIAGKQILALTFTNKAADEMKARLARLVPLPTVWMGTFHRFCARLLRMYGQLVGLSRELHDLRHGRQPARCWPRRFWTKAIDLTHATPEAIAARDQLGQEQPDGAGRVRADAAATRWAGSSQRVYPAYQRRLLASQRRRFRRSAAARGHAAEGESRGARRGSTSGIATSWSTNIRTRTWPSTRSCGRCRSTIRIWR